MTTEKQIIKHATTTKSLVGFNGHKAFEAMNQHIEFEDYR